MILFTTPTLFTTIAVINIRKTSITIEPEVPISNTDPAIERFIDPERAEETKEITANNPIGNRYLALGISITPVVKTDDKKKANITTRPVAKSVILATYELTQLIGTKNTGKRKTKTASIIPDLLINAFPELF